MPKKRGRAGPPRDRQIFGETPSVLDLKADELQEVARYLTHIEEQAQEGYRHYGRGFLLIARREGTAMPALHYVYPSDESWSGFVEEKDLMDAIATHDPITQFVVFETLVDTKQQLMTDIQISIWAYQYLLPLTPSA